MIGLDAESTASSLSLSDSKSFVLLNHNNFVEFNKQGHKKKKGLVANTADSGVMMGFVGSKTDGYMVLCGKIKKKKKENNTIVELAN